MSTMNATRGFISAMYVKFCSGPTPMYAPPDAFASASAGWRYEVSFEMMLSEMKSLSGSESEVTRPRKSGLGAASGAAEAEAAPGGAGGASESEVGAPSASWGTGGAPQAASRAKRGSARARRAVGFMDRPRERRGTRRLFHRADRDHAE